MARRPRPRASGALPKTLTGIIGLAALAAVAYLSDWSADEAPMAPPATQTALPPPPPTATAPPPTAAPPTPVGDLPNTPNSFTGSRNALYTQIYHDRRLTFYCGCSYDGNRQIDLTSCGMEVLAGRPRAQRVEAEHIYPASQFGNFRACWRNPGDFPDCVRGGGRILPGRECCQRVDPVFTAAHNDLMNLKPVVGEVNARRSNYNWGVIPGDPHEFGGCIFEVDSGTRRAEPDPAVRGDIARIMFYMADTYGFNLSRQDQQLYTAWSRMDPPDDWEIERNRRIAAIQGRGNRFVEDYAALFGGARATIPALATPAAPVTPAPAPAPEIATAPAHPEGWTCGAKTTCGQMESCEEAMFYLTQCGVTRLDGDGDGVPCNRLCNR
jgi:deoxyribonuclease I